jgi:hypothetical protein
MVMGSRSRSQLKHEILREEFGFKAKFGGHVCGKSITFPWREILREEFGFGGHVCGKSITFQRHVLVACQCTNITYHALEILFLKVVNNPKES